MGETEGNELTAKQASRLVKLQSRAVRDVEGIMMQHLQELAATDEHNRPIITDDEVRKQKVTKVKELLKLLYGIDGKYTEEMQEKYKRYSEDKTQAMLNGEESLCHILDDLRMTEKVSEKVGNEWQNKSAHYGANGFVRAFREYRGDHDVKTQQLNFIRNNSAESSLYRIYLKGKAKTTNVDVDAFNNSLMAATSIESLHEHAWGFKTIVNNITNAIGSWLFSSKDKQMSPHSYDVFTTKTVDRLDATAEQTKKQTDSIVKPPGKN